MNRKFFLAQVKNKVFARPWISRHDFLTAGPKRT
jgi:hypothetical protein